MLQSQLFICGQHGPSRAVSWERTELQGGAWVEMARGWWGGADDLFETLAAGVDWRHGRRWMYERLVDEPRLTRWFGGSDPLPDPQLDGFRAAAAARYRVPFGPLFLNFYRDGADSVAFHSDRDLRHLADTLVVILTLGAERPFLLRPSGGGRSIDLRPASGDLLVMGGTCQQTWEHSVPKVAKGAGPRISASIRWAAGPASNRVVWSSS